MTPVADGRGWLGLSFLLALFAVMADGCAAVDPLGDTGEPETVVAQLNFTNDNEAGDTSLSVIGPGKGIRQIHVSFADADLGQKPAYQDAIVDGLRVTDGLYTMDVRWSVEAAWSSRREGDVLRFDGPASVTIKGWPNRGNGGPLESRLHVRSTGVRTVDVDGKQVEARWVNGLIVFARRTALYDTGMIFDANILYMLCADGSARYELLDRDWNFDEASWQRPEPAPEMIRRIGPAPSHPDRRQAAE